MTDHTVARRGLLTPELMIETAQEIKNRHPDARLIKNRVGDLSILVDDEYIGIISLMDGGILWLTDEEGN